MVDFVVFIIYPKLMNVDLHQKVKKFSDKLDGLRNTFRHTLVFHAKRHALSPRMYRRTLL